MTLLSDLVADTKAHLYGAFREELNVLAADINTSEVDLTFTYALRGITEGGHISIGLETMRVMSVDPGQSQATVMRAVDGTTATSHLEGAVVTVRPRFTSHRVMRAINDDLRDLCSPMNGLYRVASTTVTYNPAVRGYLLPAGSSSVLEVRRDTLGPERQWPPVHGWSVMKNLPTSEFSTGIALRLDEPADPGVTLNVVYRAAFVDLTSLTQDVEAISGLPASAHDLPPLGAAVRLMDGREVSRNFTDTQGDSRRAEEVPPGAIAASPRQLERRRAMRISSEAARLAALWS